jgi:hypothetical protein
MTVELQAIQPEPPAEDLIELLEDALEKARDGKLSAVALAVVYRDGNTGHGWSRVPHVSLLAGALARVQHQFLQDHSE